MDWRELILSMRDAGYGLLAAAIIIALFSAFLAAHRI
jgi:hypothetical protein